ncbi:hypothetical protein C8R42DRAFT_663121 [Lentinula raphanica]|nr:hypothetical protein C8R42DRAFT_663121 [Lentinula raphanica]
MSPFKTCFLVLPFFRGCCLRCDGEGMGGGFRCWRWREEEEILRKEGPLLLLTNESQIRYPP